MLWNITELLDAERALMEASETLSTSCDQCMLYLSLAHSEDNSAVQAEATSDDELCRLLWLLQELVAAGTKLVLRIGERVSSLRVKGDEPSDDTMLYDFSVWLGYERELSTLETDLNALFTHVLPLKGKLSEAAWAELLTGYKLHHDAYAEFISAFRRLRSLADYFVMSRDNAMRIHARLSDSRFDELFESSPDKSESSAPPSRSVQATMPPARSFETPVYSSMSEKHISTVEKHFSRASRNDSQRKDERKKSRGLSGWLKKGNRKKKQGQPVPPPAVHSVQYSAVAATEVRRRSRLVVDVLMYEDEYRSIVDGLLEESKGGKREVRGGYGEVAQHSVVTVELTSPDIPVKDGTEERIWYGKYLDFRFVVDIPKDTSAEELLLSATVYVNRIPATVLKFVVTCSGQVNDIRDFSRRDIRSAFVSYASQDRARVAAIIQGIRKGRPDMDIFFDVESLRSGQDWEDTLRREIEKRDVLYLCWSSYARESRWVDMEWRYALEKKGMDAIEPIPIESPEICPPPVELGEKHFNDRMLYIIQSH